MEMIKFMLVMILGFPCLSSKKIRKPILKLERCPVEKYEHWSVVGPYCAIFFEEALTFGDAEDACREEHEDGHLIAVHNTKTSKDLRILTEASEERTWIGGYKVPCTDVWMWTDGSRWNYNNWVPGEPSQIGDCVQMNHNSAGIFDNAECCGRRPFVCAFLVEH